jgi:hypothetical protein
MRRKALKRGRQLKKKIVLFILTAIAIGWVLLLGGCGSSGDLQEVTPSTSSDEKQPPSTPPAKPPRDLPIASGPLAKRD